jgi:hypothetical protein
VRCLQETRRGRPQEISEPLFIVHTRRRKKEDEEDEEERRRRGRRRKKKEEEERRRKDSQPHTHTHRQDSQTLIPGVCAAVGEAAAAAAAAGAAVYCTAENCWSCSVSVLESGCTEAAAITSAGEEQEAAASDG